MLSLAYLYWFPRGSVYMMCGLSLLDVLICLTAQAFTGGH